MKKLRCEALSGLRRHRNGPWVAGIRRILYRLTLPFRLAAVLWRLTILLGVGVVRFGVNLLAAALGLLVLLFIGFGLARAFLHPLFLR